LKHFFDLFKRFKERCTMGNLQPEDTETAPVQALSNTEKLALPTIQDHRLEYVGTYMVEDLFNKEELTRLAIQDQMLTASMGGVLPEQADVSGLQRILDASCGTGGWLLEAARTIPTFSLLVGVDIRRAMINYAREQAEADPVGERVKYYVMDVLNMSQFPKACFDLVNQRLGISYLRTWDWPVLLTEYQRITRSGGIIRITESSYPESNSEALTSLNDLFLRALSQAGHMFVPDDKDSVINELVPLFHRHQLGDVQTHLHTLEFRAGTPEGQLFIEDEKHLFRTLVPFLRKWSNVPDNYKEIYRQAVRDMQSPDFVATWKLLTVWGINP
jgi:ubiquinone/menaquinone biosynthesis C-methylase UbiE